MVWPVFLKAPQVHLARLQQAIQGIGFLPGNFLLVRAGCLILAVSARVGLLVFELELNAKQLGISNIT